MDQFCGSPFWDPLISWNTDNPYFTPCFERLVLGLIPCVYLVLFTPVDLYFSYKTQLLEIPWSPLNIAKLGLTCTLALLEVLFVVVHRIVLSSSNPVDLVVPALRASVILISAALLLYSKRKGVQSSGVQFIFWLLFALTQAVRFRTVITRSSGSDVGTGSAFHLDTVVYVLEIIYFPCVVGQLFLHCWSDVVPSCHNDYELLSTKNACPEQSASFPSRTLFHWFNSLAWKGFRRPLEIPDLWDLRACDRSTVVVPAFDRYYKGNLNRGFERRKLNSFQEVTAVKKYDQSGGLFTTLAKCCGAQYLVGFIMRTITDLMMFISPMILNLLINFVGSDEPQWKGILYAVVLFICAFTGTLFNANGIHNFYMSGMRARSALISAVYRKSLLLSSSAKRAESTGEILNKMAVDIINFTDFAQYGYILFTAPTMVLIALLFLWTKLGPSALAGVIVMVVLIPVNALLASKIDKLQIEQMSLKDQRTKLMNEILSGVKVLKLYAWEASFERHVMRIRKRELDVLRTTAYLNSVSNFLWTCAPFLVAISIFGTYVFTDSTHVLDAQTAFVSLALINIMNQPLMFLVGLLGAFLLPFFTLFLTFFQISTLAKSKHKKPILISGYIQASVSIKRLNKYMNSEELDIGAVSYDPNEPNPIVIENGTFAWDEDAETLKNINFTVKDGELVAVVGTVGSGKSTLLSSLLNELTKVSGRVNIRGHLAYVAQQAWIQNATLRDNILFGLPYDHRKYNKVVEACALTPDLDMLPGGDLTEIGEKGINLSGGQKQRVALARAVYSNADVYLLDDPLSAVDAHVGKHIFEKVLGPAGLLRRKTRVLVTHGVVYLPSMDNIYVMSGGRINESGTYTQLLGRNGHFAEFLRQHLTTEDVVELQGTEIEKDLKQAIGDLSQIRRRKITSDSESEYSESGQKKRVLSLSRSSLPTATDMLPDKLIEAEKAETKSVKASVYLDYFRAAGWGAVASTFALYFVFQGFSVGANMWLSSWTNLPVVNGTQDLGQTKFYISVYGGLGFMQAIFILLATLVMAFGMVKSANVLHWEMLKRIMRAPVAFFDVTPIGRIMNRFSREVDTVDNQLPLTLRFFLNSAFQVLAVLVVISISTPIFTVVVIPVGLLYYLVQRFYVASSRQLKRLESVTRSPIYSHFGETVSGASTIRAYNQQQRFVLESEKRVDLNQRLLFAYLCSNRWLQVRLETVGNTVVFFAALFAVLGRDNLNPGLVGLSVSYALQITQTLIMMVRFTSEVETNIVAVERLKEYSGAPQEAPWEVPGREPPASWPQNGSIQFNQYKTRYRPGLELVLKNVTCTIRPGEKIGIVGRTGAGKSSMTLALFRIVEPAGGTITIDGQDISQLGLHDLRGRITIIPQDPVLFSGSLRMNLDPFETQPDAKLYHALELAHLKHFVTGLPTGLDHEIAEGGENLSVGQRQLVCLARALLRKTKILVLDEATAAVDLDTDDLIQKTIRKEFHHSTVITIAHRLNTIMDSDRVVVLEKGEIREIDSPQNLMNDPTSVFSSMAKEAGVATSQVSTRE